jgi:hypothetical protein
MHQYIKAIYSLTLILYNYTGAANIPEICEIISGGKCLHFYDSWCNWRSFTNILVLRLFRLRNVPVIPVIPTTFRSSQLLYSSFQVIPFIPIIPSRPKYNIYYWCCKQVAADSMYIYFIARWGRGGGFYKCCPLQYLPATKGERLRKPSTVYK